MAYLGDIRENSISPEGIIWETDNRKDARYYWNGAFIDLCDLPGEDYAKTIFVTSGSEPTVSKVANPITVQQISYINENGEEVYAYKAVSKQPVTSNVIVEMTIVDEFGAEETISLTITSGTATSDVYATALSTMMQQPKVVTSDYNPKEDDKFKYNTILPEEKPTLPMAYSVTLTSGSIDTISDEALIKEIKKSGEISMKDEVTSENFMISFTPIAVDGLSSMTPKEITQALINNSQDIIIVTDKDIKSIEQAQVAGINEISLWNKRGGVLLIDGVPFTVWYKRDEGQTSQSKIYDPVTKEVIGVEDREYIIYYN